MKDNIYKCIQLNTIPVNLFTKVYNGVQYQLGMTIFYMDQQSYYINISQQAFNKLIIRNSLDGIYPTASISFTDYNGAYTSHLKHVGEYIRIKVLAPKSTQTQQQKNPSFDLYFSIENHKMTSYTNKEITYELECRFWTARNLAMHINYATYINDEQSNMVSPYTLIANILKKINYPIKQENIPPSNRAIYYITDQNSTVKDMIDYCLYYGCDQDNPPTYLFHHIIDNEPVLYNQNFIQKITKYKVNMGLSLITDQGVGDVNKELIIQNPILFSNNPSILHYQEKALYIQWQYDHMNRTWSQNIYTPNKIDKLLTISQDQHKLIKSSFYPETYEESNIRTYKYNFDTDIYEKMKDLDLNTNNIKFSVIGNILRQVGQPIYINGHQKNYYNTFCGLWQIYSILHIFDEKTYTNNIIGYRTFNMNHAQDEQT